MCHCVCSPQDVFPDPTASIMAEEDRTLPPAGETRREYLRCEEKGKHLYNRLLTLECTNLKTMHQASLHVTRSRRVT